MTDLLRHLFDDQLPGQPPPPMAIHPEDEMLTFLTAAHGGDPDQGRMAYFATGLSIARVYEQLLRWRFGNLDEVGHVLDFASGYGRVTRHLLRELPAERIWVAEIHPEAVAFQEGEWGVHGLVSAPRAEGFRCPERFDAILVTSLFTHLPEPAFKAWLRRLCELLRPGGMLVLSAHDVSLRLANERPPPGELLFNAVSESRALDTREYGSAWIDESFMRHALAEIDPSLQAHRLDRALLQHQDLYLVLRPDREPETAEPGRAPSSPELALRTEPTGYVEGFVMNPGGELLSHGWTLDFTGRAPLRAIELKVDGEPVGAAHAFGPRPDVASAHYLPPDRATGWQVTGKVPEGRSRSRVIVLVKATSGGETAQAQTESILFLGTLEAALLRSAERRIDALEEEVRHTRKRAVLALGRLRHRISAMRASRFWRLRNRWFRLKKKLGRIDKIWPP